MTSFEVNTKALAHTAPMKPHPGVPEGNAFEFYFSSPFTKNTPLVKSLHLTKHVLPRDIPVERPLFYSPETGNGISFEALRSTALRVAQALSSLDLGPSPSAIPGLAGDVGADQRTILLHMSNSIAFPILVFAGLAGKFILTMASPALTTTELAHVIRESRPVIAFSTDTGIQKTRDAFKEANVPTPSAIWAVRGVDGLAEGDGKDGERTWTELSRNKQELKLAPMSREDQQKTVSFILWSSGTTGKSKGVVLSHWALINQGISLWIGNPVFRDEERFVGLPPFYHTYGLGNILLASPMIGATVILLPKFDLESYLRLVKRYRITHMHIVAPIAVQLSKTPLLDAPWNDTSSVTGATAGGAPLGPPVIREVNRRMGVPIRMGYGTSESGSITSMNGTTWKELEPQLGSTGVALWGVELRIVDANGKDVAQGESGEIYIRSPNQMLGYINAPEITAEAMDEHRWVHSGDVGVLDQNNNLYIVDRIKEVIKYKGFQVSPSELDGVINGLPSVLDVGVTSVYSDDEGSEMPIAYVVPRAQLKDEAAIRKFAFEVRAEVEKKCAKYKWLRGGCVVVDAIPKNPSGKILRRMLKDVKGTHIPLYSRDSKL